ncbi:MAG: radical SAM protein [Candidatus Eremiobacterota bacterium]
MFREIKFAFNIFYSYINFIGHKEYVRSRPSLFWIEPTNYCNLKCPMCPGTYTDERIKKGFMSFDLFKDIVDEISPYVLETYLMLGGESLLHKDIVGMVRYAKMKKLNVLMDTNGVLLHEDLGRELLESGLDFISISFDGYERDTYEKIRVNAKFDGTLKNIRSFLNLKKINNHNIFVRIRSMEDSSGKGAFSSEKREAFRSLFSELPVDDFIVLPFGNWNQDFPDNENVSIPGLTVIDPSLSNYHPCPYLWTSLCIRWDGTVVACCLDLLNQLLLGDRKNKNLLHIWNDEPVVELRHKHITGEINRPCSNCTNMITKTVLGVPAGGFCGPTSLARTMFGMGMYKGILSQSGYLRRKIFPFWNYK